jgi:hypothetical protein
MKILPPPGPARTRQMALLGALLVGAVYAGSRVWPGGPATPAVATSNPQTPPIQKVVPPNAMPQPLELDKLDPASEPPTTTRNPFAFGVRPAPPAPARVYAPPAAPSSAAPAGPIVPPIPLKFIGRAVLPNRQIVATLSDGRGSVLQGVEGQILDGRYRIVRIGEESLVIEYVDGTGRVTLPLRGS